LKSKTALGEQAVVVFDKDHGKVLIQYFSSYSKRQSLNYIISVLLLTL